MKLISIMAAILILASCVSVPTIISTPEAAIAHATTLSIVQFVIPLFMAACIIWLVIARTEEVRAGQQAINAEQI